MERTKKNRLLYLKNKIICVFDLERIKLKRYIRRLEKTNKKLNDENEELRKNNEFLFNELETFRKRLRKKIKFESENKKIR